MERSFGKRLAWIVLVGMIVGVYSVPGLGFEEYQVIAIVDSACVVLSRSSGLFGCHIVEGQRLWVLRLDVAVRGERCWGMLRRSFGVLGMTLCLEFSIRGYWIVKLRFLFLVNL